jgi:hypothetical protein
MPKLAGMTLVPGGAFIMGKSAADLADIQDNSYSSLLLGLFIWMKRKSLTISSICGMG